MDAAMILDQYGTYGSLNALGTGEGGLRTGFREHQGKLVTAQARQDVARTGQLVQTARRPVAA